MGRFRLPSSCLLRNVNGIKTYLNATTNQRRALVWSQQRFYQYQYVSNPYNYREMNFSETSGKEPWEPHPKYLVDIKRHWESHEPNLNELIRNDLPLARNLFRKVLQQHYSKDMGMWNKWGTMEWKAGNHELARMIFTKASKISFHSDLWQSWASMEAEIKNYAEARRLFSLILATDSNNASAGLGLALVESACGKHEKAREMFQELHKNHPNDLVILQAFGIFETKQQNMILARDIFQTAASNSNCTVQVWHAWARAEYDYGFYKNALTVLERAQITFPLHKWLVQLAGMTHFKLGEIQEARKKFKRLTEGGIFVEPSAYNAYAKMEEQLGNDHLAIELYNDVLRNAPEHIPSIMSLATLQQKNTGRMGGRRIFEQALAKFESLNKGEQLVGDLLFAWGNFEEIHGDLNHAKALYEESTKKAPTKVEAWKALAQIESLLGDLEAARAVLTMASQHCPSEVALLLQLAKIEAKHKNYRHARNACEKALRIDKLNASAWNIRATLELPHQPERARKLVENALTILPRYEKQSWSILLCTYGRAFALLEDYDKASQAFQKSLRMSPNNWETHVLYADSVLVPNEAIEEARRHYKVALQLAPGKKKSRVQSKMPPSQVVPRPVT